MSTGSHPGPLRLTRRRKGQWGDPGDRSNEGENAASGIIQESYPAYGLDWDELKEYLLKIWPGLVLEEHVVRLYLGGDAFGWTLVVNVQYELKVVVLSS